MGASLICTARWVCSSGCVCAHVMQLWPYMSMLTQYGSYCGAISGTSVWIKQRHDGPERRINLTICSSEGTAGKKKKKVPNIAFISGQKRVAVHVCACICLCVWVRLHTFMFVFYCCAWVWDFQSLQDVLCQPVRIQACVCVCAFEVWGGACMCVRAHAQVGSVIKVISV